MKQETLEEAGVAYAKTVNQNHTSHMLGFHNGAKWQSERMYSEEEVLNFTQTMIMQYRFGNTNIKQLELLKENLQLFKKK